MKIKKSRLMQIIQEEISRMDEVEVIRRKSKKNKELELWDQWKNLKDSEDIEDKAKAEEAFRELYEPISAQIIPFLNSKKFKTLDDNKIKDIKQDVFLKIIEKPELFGGRAALSSFLKGNAVNQARDQFRRITTFGGTPTSTGQTTAQSDILQQQGDFLDVMGGSRFSDPEKRAIARDELTKLAKEISDSDKIQDEISKEYVELRLAGVGQADALRQANEAAAQKDVPGISQAKASRIDSYIKSLRDELHKINVNEGKEGGGINLEEAIKAAIMEMLDEGAIEGLDEVEEENQDDLEYKKAIRKGEIPKPGYKFPKDYKDPEGLGTIGDLEENTKESIEKIIAEAIKSFFKNQ